MIDTDKYEGHDNWEGTKVNMANEANKLLVADAPLLLEEVKRLREKLNETEYRLEMAEDVLGRSDWNTIYRELIEEVKE